MATQEEELRLSVTLDDQASASLGNLQAMLGNISAAINPTQQAISQLSQSLKGAGGHAGNLHGGLMGMAAKGGFIAGFFLEVGRSVEKMAQEFADATLDLKAYADSMVQLDQNARRSATSMAQFRSNVAIFRESGIGAEDATKMLRGYADAVADLQRQDSPLRTAMLAGQRGEYRDRMEDLLRTVMTADQQTGINALRQAGRLVREEHERRGQPERGAAAEASLYARWGMPGLERVRGELRAISQEETRMYNDRKVDAQRYQVAIEQQKDAWERSVSSVQAIAFQLLPIADTTETLAHWAEATAAAIERFERAIPKAKAAAEAAAPAPTGWQSVNPFNPANIAREQAAAPGLHGFDTTTTGMDIEFNPFASKDVRPGLPTSRSGRPSYAPQHLLGDGGASAGGPGGALDMSAIPSIADLLKPQPGAIIAPFNPDDYAGTGWRGLPMSKNIETAAEDASNETDDNTEQMGELAKELTRLNEFLAPTTFNLPFHNAPMGGAAGESNPIQIPPNVAQPGGGAAAEARPLLRPWRSGDPVTGTHKGKPYPFLDPTQGTPLPPRDKTFSGVSEGRGVASWYGQGEGWGDKASMDAPGSNALRVPEHLQGISLSSPETLGQFFYVTDPNTGLTHVRQQTDAGPGVRTQKIVDVSVAAAQREGYTQQSFEAQQSRVARGEIPPWEVRNTGFGSQGRSTAPAPRGRMPTVETQNISRIGGGAELPSGMDVEFNPFDYKSPESGGPAWSTLDSGGGRGGGGGALDADGGALDASPSRRVSVNTSGMFSVNVNAPEGTSVKAEGSGLLGKTDLSRSMPMED